MTRGLKAKQNGCLRLSLGKRPRWPYDIIQLTCPGNWVHIKIWSLIVSNNYEYEIYLFLFK